MSDGKLNITPQTKIGELLDNYPQLEELLISVAPAFKKLQNPVLRKTVAKITSISQAARVGGLEVGELVSKLRREVGLAETGETITADSSTLMGTEPPDWLVSDKIVDRLNAREMIEAGEQPLGKVMQALDRLAEGEIFELITPFEPAPLIDQALEKGYQVWSGPIKEANFRTVFHKWK